MKPNPDELVKILKKDRDVLAVILYGSVARNKETPLSDIDVCVVLKRDMKNKYIMSKKRLKYLTFAHRRFDIQIFQLMPLYIRIRILREGKILYCRHLKHLYTIAHETINSTR